MHALTPSMFVSTAVVICFLADTANACHKRKHRCDADSEIIVGVSWSNIQDERWRTDEAAIKAELEASGATYIATDAQSSSAKQLSDVESLIAQGVDALIIVAQDTQAILPAVEAATLEGIPVIGYDRFIEDSRARYLSFDSVEVGRLQAQTILEASPTGNYVIIKGSPTDPNSDFLRAGQQETLQKAIDSGQITIVGEAYTDGWLPANAQRNMEQILTATDNEVDAVIASNDGTAGGVVAALTAQGREGIPVSGQGGDVAALNRIAKGTQTVSIWKDARELGTAAAITAIALAQEGSDHEFDDDMTFTTPAGVEINAYFEEPIPITRENLSVVIDAGWITQEELCQGVTEGPAPCD